jgi:N-acetyl sugar amidotransferase
MRYCARCCYPENTKPSIIFDDEGVCSGCRTFENRPQQNVDWKARQKKLQEILNEYKEKAKQLGSPYDCILPVGGGKDSHYQAYMLTQVYKVRPLLVTYNSGYNTKIGIRNLTNIVEKFGLDLVRYNTNPKTAKKLSRYMLKKVGDVTWHYHAGINTFVMQAAARYKTPLVVWGEHGMAYMFGMYNFDDDVEFTKKHRQEHMMRGFEPDDVLDDPENTEIIRADLAPFYYPEDDELEKIGVRGIFMGQYDPWNAHEHTRFVMENYGFETLQNRDTTYNLYEKIEDYFNDTHNYLKYLKFGYGRCTDHASMDIRHQRITREQGIEFINQFEYQKKPKNLAPFLKFIEMNEQEFEQSIEHLRDPDIWEKQSDGSWKILDWVGNHVNDDGVEKARLPIIKELDHIKSQKYKSPRKYTDEEDAYDEMVYL